MADSRGDGIAMDWTMTSHRMSCKANPSLFFSAVVTVVAVITAAAPAAQDRVPTPAEDTQMLHTFRANVLQELGLMEAHEQYLDPSKAPGFPKTTDPGAQEEIRRWVFTLAIRGVQLEWMGYSDSANTPRVAAERTKSAFLSVLGRVFRTFAPGELEAVSGRWTAPTDSQRSDIDPGQADRLATQGEAAARALLRAHVPEKAATYDSAPPLAQADLLLEAGEAVTRGRSWPTAYILYLTDTGNGFSGLDSYVKKFLGVSSPEYQQWPKMSDRQRGAAIKQALLAAFAVSRQLAQGQIDAQQWMAATGERDIFAKPQAAILLAGGQTLWDRYRRAADAEQRDIVVAAMLKALGWLWTLQAAL
jgi:hypothetical protein